MRNCVKGPGKYGRSLSDMFGGMSVENKSVFGCPEVQQRCDSAKGECGEHVCQVKRTLTKDTAVYLCLCVCVSISVCLFLLCM